MDGSVVVRSGILPVLAVCVVVGLVVGCAPGTDQPESSVLMSDTLPSGRILVRVNASRDSPAWEIHERLRIGTIEGDGPHVFGAIRDVALGLRGETIVLDGQAAEVRVFGPDGAYLHALGRPGEGPGELNRPAGMTLDRDGHVWVMNWGNARYTAFDPTTGELVEEHRRLASFVAFPWPGAFDADGRLVDVGLNQTAEATILRLDSAFVPSDTLPFPRPDGTHQILIRRGDTPVMYAADPFAPQPVWAPASVGIIVGEGGVYRLHRVGFDGDTTRTVEISTPRIPVTASERDSALASFRELIESAGGTPERQPRVPDTKPAHGPLLVDDQDRAWVRQVLPAGEPPGWDVIGPDGDYVGHVRLPTSMDAMLQSVRASRMAVSAELGGVPTVIVYEFVPPFE